MHPTFVATVTASPNKFIANTHITQTGPDNPRALDAKEYAKVFESLGIEAVPCNSIEDAVVRAIAWAKEAKLPIISLGSLYMYGDVCKALAKIK